MENRLNPDIYIYIFFSIFPPSLFRINGEEIPCLVTDDDDLIPVFNSLNHLGTNTFQSNQKTRAFPPSIPSVVSSPLVVSFTFPTSFSLLTHLLRNTRKLCKIWNNKMMKIENKRLFDALI